MGATYVDVTIRNPAVPKRSWTGKFLVDTGAFDTLVPRSHLERNRARSRGAVALTRLPMAGLLTWTSP